MNRQTAACVSMHCLVSEGVLQMVSPPPSPPVMLLAREWVVLGTESTACVYLPRNVTVEERFTGKSQLTLTNGSSSCNVLRRMSFNFVNSSTIIRKDVELITTGHTRLLSPGLIKIAIF